MWVCQNCPVPALDAGIALKPTLYLIDKACPFAAPHQVRGQGDFDTPHYLLRHGFHVFTRINLFSFRVFREIRT